MKADNPTRGEAPAHASADCLARGGMMGAQMRLMDWAATPLGPVETWPQALRSAIGVCLNARFPIALYWGPQLALLYNDAWSPIPGAKHPWALGRPAREVWPEIWDTIGPLFAHVAATGEGTYAEDQLLPMQRRGFTEECYFNFTFSPILGDDGRIAGIFNAVIETTYRVVDERRTRLLRMLADRASTARSEDEVCTASVAAMAEDAEDVPFCLLYLFDKDGSARLICGAGLADTAAASGAIDAWPFAKAIRSGHAELVDGVPARLGGQHARSPWPEPVELALVAPLARVGLPGDLPPGFLVVGVSPRLAADESYRAFAERAAAHVAGAVANGRAYETERRRSEALAELDRAKTAFFTNVSHEFRTPLTLMLGPLEEALEAGRDALPPDLASLLEVAQRNGQRLLRLVNNLLDFSRVEAGHAEVQWAPIDLATLTTDLVSAFRSACERAGLWLDVQVTPRSAPVLVDAGMWEKIVLNLVSNAFKFTFEGGIAVTLRQADGRTELQVADTGTGIPEGELPRLFDRFHRVEGAEGRSHEGSGIGLALVQELVRLLGGSVAVDSGPGRGSRFTVSVPLAPATGALSPAAPASPAGHAPRSEAFVEEALSWLPPAAAAAEVTPAHPAVGDAPAGGVGGARILVADDNADMRAYLCRLLLAAGYRVEAAGDGRAAFDLATTAPPDLVLSDVMMPRLDGFGLLRALREDPRTREVPVLLLSARTGEQAQVEGLDADADDYMVKPFSAREMLARVGANLRLARLRREAAEAERRGQVRWRDLVGSMQEGFMLGEMLFDAAGAATDFRYLEVNRAWETMAGLPASAVLNRRVSEALPGLEAHWVETYAQVVATGEPAHFEAYHTPMRRWLSVSAYRIGPGRFGVLLLDITARKAFEENQALLMRELDHRAKNVLAVVQSVVRLTRATDVEGYAEAVEGRVAALSRAHNLLAQDRWQGADLRSLVEEELAAYQGGQVTIAGPQVRLLTEAVQPLSMVVHELATNAAKYGALSVADGRLSVSWEFIEEGRHLRLLWQERDGPPIFRRPALNGFGSTLIQATVHGQLGGRAEKQWPPGGLRCEVTIAADRLAEPDEAPTAALNGAKARPATAGSLQQLAILVVEDEPVVALELAGTLQSLGCEVVGPAGTLEQALRLGASEAGRLAAAVVDVNLHGRSAFPVAELLGDRGVPVVWASGYGELPPGFVGRTAFELVRKPVTKGQIAAALRRAIAAVAQARSGVDDGSTIGDGGTSCGPGSEFGSRTGAGTSCGGGSDGGATGG